MQFPITKWMGVSAGLLPYSFSGYNFSQTDSIPVTSTEYSQYTTAYSGSGGISQVYTGLAVELFNHVSLGANVYYMFGDSENARMISWSSSDYSARTSLENNVISISSFSFRYGMQFFHTFNEKHQLTLGLIYENKARMKGDFAIHRYENYPTPTDTIVFDNNFQQPTMLGVGINYTLDNNLSISADYQLQQWNNALFFGKTDSLNNRMKVSLGAEYIINPRGNKYGDRIRYRAGLNMHNPYYKTVGGSQPLNFGISFGVGLPLRTSNTMLNAAVEYGKVGTSSLFREDYFKLTFNATFNENWFFKRKL